MMLRFLYFAETGMLLKIGGSIL